MREPPSHQLPLSFEPERIEERQPPWAVRVSRRARRLSIRVFHSGRVEIIAPTRMSSRTIEQFVTRHRSWIERKRLASMQEQPIEAFPPQRVKLAASAESWDVSVEAGESDESLRRALRSRVIERAREFLPQQLAMCAESIGVRYGRAVIRCQRTRWGSCSRRGTISLNACAMFQRPEVMHYLLVHELAHLTHMNHSQRFWCYVERHVPNYRELDRELRSGWRRVPQWFEKGIAAP